MCINRTGDGGAVRPHPRPSPFALQKGISLIELIMFIMIVSVALAGILLVMNTVTRGSADPVIHKQALAIAESLLEEIELQDFSLARSSAVTRANYSNVMDYNGYTTNNNGIVAPDGNAILPLANYNIMSTTVASAVLGEIPATSAVVITVTVRAPSGETIDAVGYRVAY